MKLEGLLLPLLLTGILGCSSLNRTNIDMSPGYLTSSFLESTKGSGVKDFQIKDGNGSFGLRLKQAENTTEPKPLIVALHWHGSGEVFKEFASCLIQPAFEEVDVHVVVPDAQEQVWYSDMNVRRVLDLVKEAKRRWAVDEDKIIVVGYSNGGNGSWYYADNYPNIFKAAIPMASSYTVDHKVKCPVYMIHGYRDELFDINRSMKFAERIKSYGSNVTVAVNNNLSHYEACAYVTELRSSLPWLKKTLKWE